MAAAQPFLSGAISKTVNLPESASVEDIMNTYIEGWRLGLKSVAIYREGSKRSAPLNTRKTKDMGTAAAGVDGGETAEVESRILELEQELATLRRQLDQPVRHRMPDTRTSLTHKFEIAGHEGYITVGLYRGRPAGRTFHHHVEGGQHHRRFDGYRRHAHIYCSPIRRATREVW